MRWLPSDRRSRGSRPGSRSRRCSSGRARPLPRRSRLTCSARRCSAGRQLGEALRLRPVRALRRSGQTWSPLRRASSWDGALEVAWRLAAAGELDQRGVEGGDFWAIAAEQRLAPLLYAAAQSGGGIEQVVAWAYGQGSARSTRRSIGWSPSAASERGATRRPGGVRRRARVRGAGRPHPHLDRGHGAGAAAGLPVHARGALGARLRDHAPSACSRSNATLYLIGDAKASKLLRPIFLALLSEVVDAAYELANRSGGRLRSAAADLPRRGRERRAAAEPRRDRLDGTEPQHPADLDLPRPRAGPKPLSPAGRDGDQQPPRADAAAGRRRPGHAALLLGPGRRGGAARGDAHERPRRRHAARTGTGARR